MLGRERNDQGQMRTNSLTGRRQNRADRRNRGGDRRDRSRNRSVGRDSRDDSDRGNGVDVGGGNGAREDGTGDGSLGRVDRNEDGLRGLDSAGSLDMAERERTQLAHRSSLTGWKNRVGQGESRRWGDECIGAGDVCMTRASRRNKAGERLTRRDGFVQPTVKPGPQGHPTWRRFASCCHTGSRTGGGFGV